MLLTASIVQSQPCSSRPVAGQVSDVTGSHRAGKDSSLAIYLLGQHSCLIPEDLRESAVGDSEGPMGAREQKVTATVPDVSSLLCV